MYRIKLERYWGFCGIKNAFHSYDHKFGTYEDALQFGESKADELCKYYPLHGFRVIVMEGDKIAE